MYRCVAGQRSGRHGVRRDHASPRFPRLPPGAVRGLEVSRSNILQDLLLQRQIGDRRLRRTFSRSSSFIRFTRSTSSPPYSFRHSVVALLRYASFLARYRRRLALRHQHFNLTKQNNNLLRVKPLLRHLQAPLPSPSLIRPGPKKPGQVNIAGAYLLYDAPKASWREDNRRVQLPSGDGDVAQKPSAGSAGMGSGVEFCSGHRLAGTGEAGETEDGRLFTLERQAALQLCHDAPPY